MSRFSVWPIALVIAALLVSPAQGAAAPSLLGKIDCLDLRVAEVGPVEEALEITHDLLYAALKVAITTDLPRLSLEPGCGDELHVIAMVASPDGGESRQARYAMTLRLELRRQASLAGKGATGAVTVWDLGTLIMGRQEEAKQAALDAVSDLASAFLAEYHAAGNP